MSFPALLILASSSGLTLIAYSLSQIFICTERSVIKGTVDVLATQQSNASVYIFYVFVSLIFQLSGIIFYCRLIFDLTNVNLILRIIYLARFFFYCGRH